MSTRKFLPVSTVCDESGFERITVLDLFEAAVLRPDRDVVSFVLELSVRLMD